MTVGQLYVADFEISNSICYRFVVPLKLKSRKTKGHISSHYNL